MYLIDTDVISETRKKARANAGVTHFFTDCATNDVPVFISVITVGEIRRGVELIRYRGDISQASSIETWLNALLVEFTDYVLDFSLEAAQVWGHLRVPRSENPLDKQIAATALTHDLQLVTRNVSHFEGLGVPLLNPFV